MNKHFSLFHYHFGLNTRPPFFILLEDDILPVTRPRPSFPLLNWLPCFEPSNLAWEAYPIPFPTRIWKGPSNPWNWHSTWRCVLERKRQRLGGGFQHFLLLPWKLEKWSNLTSIFCRWVVQPPPRKDIKGWNIRKVTEGTWNDGSQEGISCRDSFFFSGCTCQKNWTDPCSCCLLIPR